MQLANTVPTNPEGPYAELIRMTKELERRVAKRSPFYMAKYIMGHGQRRNGKLWGWNHRHVRASKLIWWAYSTRHERPWGTKIYLEWCRGSRKSTLLQAAAACILLDDPNLTCLLDSDVMKKAAQKTGVIRDLFSDEYFIDLFGNQASDTKWKAEQWTLKRTVKTADATMAASGLDASKTGGHFDIIMSDDLQTDENADSPTINEEVKRNYKLYETLKSGKISTVTLIAGTRWGFKDLGYDLQKEMDEEISRGLPRSIFIDREAAHPMDKNGKLDIRFATFAEGGLTVEQLKRNRLTMKPSLYSFNFLLQPLSEDEALFKSQWVRHHNKALADLPDGTRIYLSVDPAGEGKFKGADFSALVTIAVTPSAEIFVMETRNLHVTKLELFEEIVALNEIYKPNGVVIEKYFQQAQLASWMRTQASKRLISIPWMELKVDRRSKEARISALQPFMQSGKIWWRKEHTELEDQALQYPRADHDDLIDALAQAVKAASVPKESNTGPWFMSDNYLEEFAPTPSQPKPPTELAVLVARAEYRKKQEARMGRMKKRFRFGGPA